ncbi:MAG: hypothetical protein V3U72_04820 [Candidatus Aenigmarchaeota archaeon]
MTRFRFNNDGMTYKTRGGAVFDSYCYLVKSSFSEGEYITGTAAVLLSPLILPLGYASSFFDESWGLSVTKIDEQAGN